MNQKLIFAIIGIILVGIGVGSLQISGMNDWVLRVETQCSNPWDEYMGERLDNLRNDPDFEDTSRSDGLKIREGFIIDFYKTQNIEILDFHIDENFEEPDACESCNCNAGGHAFFARVNDSDKEFLLENGWESTLSPKI